MPDVVRDHLPPLLPPSWGKRWGARELHMKCNSYSPNSLTSSTTCGENTPNTTKAGQSSSNLSARHTDIAYSNQKQLPQSSPQTVWSHCEMSTTEVSANRCGEPLHSSELHLRDSSIELIQKQDYNIISYSPKFKNTSCSVVHRSKNDDRRKSQPVLQTLNDDKVGRVEAVVKSSLLIGADSSELGNKVNVDSYANSAINSANNIRKFHNVKSLSDSTRMSPSCTTRCRQDRGGVFFHRRSGLHAALVAIILFIALGLDNRIPTASATERPRYRTTYACEGSTLNMNCEAGHVINLIRANYGRFSITICNEHGNTEWSVNCMSRRSHRVLHDKCSQRQNCSVAASTRGFGDPCPGTLKYLEAQFQCLPVNLPHGRPRPIWLVDAQSTVSSITGDQPLKRPPLSRDAIRQLDGSDAGLHGSPHNPMEDLPGGLGLAGDETDRIAGSGLLDPDNGSSSSTSTTTTLRPPPWLKTNVAKNSTTTTTTSTTTSTTTTTTSSPQSSDASAPPLPSPSNNGPSHKPTYNGQNIPVIPDTDDLEEQRDLDKVETAEREDLFEEQNRILEKELGIGFSQNYPKTSTGPGRTVEDSSVPGGWRPLESWCSPSTSRGLPWNWTMVGDMAIQPCPGGASGWARRACLQGGWDRRADLGECRSVWLTTLTERALGSDSVLAVVHDLSAVTARRAFYGGDVTAAARLLTSLAKRMATSLYHFPDTDQREALLSELLSATLSSASHLIGCQEEAWGDLRPSEHQAAATALLLGLEEAAFLLANNLRQQKTVGHSLTNILMRLQVLETRNIAPITFPSADEVWQTPSPLHPTPTSECFPSSSSLEPAASSIILHPSPTSPHHQMSTIPSSSSSPAVSSPRYYDSITLPPEALVENSESGWVRMVFFSYQGLEKLLQPSIPSYGSAEPAYKRQNRTRQLNSRVLAASLGSGRHIELSEPVIINFALLKTHNVTNASCVFWDYTTNLWSEEGCRVIGYNVTHVRCQCDHLTNFAVLMDFHSTPLPPEHSLALSVITYIGCVVSIVCLLLAIVVFHVFKSLKSDRTSIHKNLCICLLIAEVVFVGGINQTANPIVCGVVAGLLHYFFLAAFAWMFMEGLQLYLLLVEVFEAERSRFKWYCGVAYGTPALVVLVSAAVGHFSYGTEEVCWLRTDNYFIFAFVGPVAAVLLANAVFLILSLVVLCRHASASASLKNKEHTKLASVRTWLRGAFVLMFLLGLTWTFGLLYLNQQTLVMAYVFTIFNSLQGLFIFVFHCIQNDKLAGLICKRPAIPQQQQQQQTQDNYQLENNVQHQGHTLAMGPRESVTRASRSSNVSSGKLNRSNSNGNQQQQLEDEKYSFKSCGRDSGHGGSEQEDSPRTGTAGKLTSLRLNNNVAPHQPADRLVNSFTQHQELPSPEGLLPDYRLAGDGLRLPQHPRLRNQSPYNHTYTEISEGGKSVSSRLQPDPVYEEIEREGRLVAELQVSDLSDEDGRRMSSDVSRQSSRSYGDHRPLLPYSLPDHLHASLQHLPHHHLHQLQHQLHQHQLHQNHVQQVHMQQQHQLQQQQIQQQLQQQNQLQHQIHQQQQQHNQQLQQHHHHHHPQHAATAPQQLNSPHQIIATNHQISPYETRPRPDVLNLHPEDVGPLNTRHPQLQQQQQQQQQQSPVDGGCGGPLQSVVQPLSEPNLRSWEAVQHRRDMAQLQQQLGEMTVAVLNGEQVVCKLKSPLAPIQETTSSAAVQQVPPISVTAVELQQQQQQEQHSPQTELQQPTQQPQIDQQQLHKHPVTSLTYSHC
uniref:Latrophilin Cirl-like isoform X6 n=1 Tax=Hirondellea gigas TaxID=1518452 RepID=A0A6A7FTK4_9CRUS